MTAYAASIRLWLKRAGFAGTMDPPSNGGHEPFRTWVSQSNLSLAGYELNALTQGWTIPRCGLITRGAKRHRGDFGSRYASRLVKIQ